MINTKWYCDSSKYASVTAWANGAVTAAGLLRRQLATPTVGNERVFASIVAGTTGGSEPAWTLTAGAKTTDNTVTWQECTGQPGINGDLTNCPTWNSVKNTAVTLGQIIQNVAGNTLFICSTAGTAGNGSEPTWNTTAGQTTADNTVTWTSLGAASGFSAFAAPHARIDNALASGWANQSGGDDIYVGSGHASTRAAAATFTLPGSGSVRTRVVCVSNSAAPPTATTTGASETTTGANAITLGGYGYYEGVAFHAGTGFPGGSIIGGAVNFAIRFRKCTFDIPGTGSNNIILPGTQSNKDNLADCDQCTFSFGATSNNINPREGFLNIKNATIAATGTVPTNLFSITSTAVVTCRDTDLSNINTNLVLGTNTVAALLRLQNCKTNSGLTLVNGALSSVGGNQIETAQLDSSGTNYKVVYQTGLGKTIPETTIVRTGGASDGTTPLSWNITSTAQPSFETPYQSPEIAQWNSATGSSKTATVYLASSTALTNGDVWLEVEYPGSAASPLGSIVSSAKSDLLQSNAALTSDGSTWGGSPANVYSIASSFTPQLAGIIKARLFVAKASVTVYVDPKMVIA